MAGTIVQPEIEQETEQTTRQDLEWIVAESFGDRGRVIVHNDDVTPYEFVIVVLKTIFHLSPPDAEGVTWEAHTTGAAAVGVLPMEEAKYRVGQAHDVARQAGFPLTFTIESE